jgi:enoyl reductase-like protein
MSESMPPERLAEITARWAAVPGEPYWVTVTGASQPGVTMTALSHAGEDVPALVAEVERLTAQVAALESALTGQRERIAQDVNRARRPVFAKGETPENVAKTTRAIDIRLIEMGPAAPYWVPEAGEPRG